MRTGGKFGKGFGPRRGKSHKLPVSKCFETAERKRLPVKMVLEYAKATGLHKAEIREVRKRLRATPKKEDGDYWRTWPEDTDPGEINRQKSEERINYDREGN